MPAVDGARAPGAARVRNGAGARGSVRGARGSGGPGQNGRSGIRRPGPLPRATAAPAPAPRRPGCAPPRVTHTRTPIYETRTAHKGLIPPLCAVRCCLIPSRVCDIEGQKGQADGGNGGSAPAPHLKAGPKGVSLKGGGVWVPVTKPPPA